MMLHQENTNGNRDVLSMEEYLLKRKKIRLQEEMGRRHVKKEEKSPAFLLAELYV